MKRLGFLLVGLGAIAFFVGSSVPLFVGHAAAAPTPGNASVTGTYAFSDSTHDSATGQEGAAVGTMVFDGAGNISGTVSANYRFNPACSTPCGDLLVTHVPYSGTYSVRSDGSVLIDMCISNPSGPVRAVFEGAFSSGFRSLRFLVSEIGTTLSCTATLTQAPNTTTGTADKL